MSFVDLVRQATSVSAIVPLFELMDNDRDGMLRVVDIFQTLLALDKANAYNAQDYFRQIAPSGENAVPFQAFAEWMLGGGADAQALRRTLETGLEAKPQSHDSNDPPRAQSRPPASGSSRGRLSSTGAGHRRTATARATSTPALARAAAPPQLVVPRGLDYLCWLRGAVLITAPHSLQLTKSGNVGRNHKRERWTAEIAVALARELHRRGLPAAVMVWNRAAPPARGRLDPNYLQACEFASSPWHRALHRWQAIAGNGDPSVPLMHVDLHGKVSEKCHLDLGVAPLEEAWPRHEQSFVASFKSSLARNLDTAMARGGAVTIRRRQILVDKDPALHGFWGKDTVTTISHQSALLGVPAFQLEMPPALRSGMVQEGSRLVAFFAEALIDTYLQVVAPWWAEHSEANSPQRPSSLPLSRELCSQVSECGPLDASGFEAWSTQLLDELMEMERTSSELQI